MNAVKSSEALALVDHGEEARHSKAHLAKVVVAIEDLLHLLAHEEVGLELVFFFQQHVPQLVQVAVAFEAELFGAPRTAGLQLLALVLGVARPLLHVFGGGGHRAGETSLLGLLLAALNLLEVVPVDAHFIN